MDAPAEPDAVTDVVKRVHRTLDNLERLQGSPAVDASTGARSHSNLTVNGQASWHITACLLAAFAGAGMGGFGLYMAKDARDEMRARSDEQAEAMRHFEAEQKADLREARNDIKAIRAYINAGLMPGKGK